MKNSYRMKKYILDLKVTENLRLHTNYVLLKFTTVDGSSLPPMAPGQFAEVRVDGSPTTFLRRPISINYIDMDNNELWLLIQLVGDGTKKLSTVSPGQTVNMVLPLGNTFTIPEDKASQLILIGGGIGTATMLYLGYELKQQGYNPIFLLGARSATDILQLKEFKTLGDVFITTEDGTLGEKGYVTQHSVLIENKFDKIMDYNWILLKGMRYYMETIKIQHLFGRFSIFFLVLIVAVFAEEYSINRLCLNINGFPFIFMNAFMIVGIDYKDIQLFKFYESVSEHLRIS